MMLLAIDTASAHASVALLDARGLLAEETWYAQRHHDDRLFPAVDRLLAAAGAQASDIGRVAVAVGPGSFTGLRVAVAAAQGIARAAGARAVAVTTCDAAAAALRPSRRQVAVVLPAGMGEHYWALYPPGTETSGIETGALGQLASRIATDTLFTGDIDPATASEIERALGARAEIAPVDRRVRRAGHLAALAWERAEAGGTIAPEALEPLYIRPPLVREMASSQRQGQ